MTKMVETSENIIATNFEGWLAMALGKRIEPLKNKFNKIILKLLGVTYLVSQCNKILEILIGLLVCN